MNDDLEPLLRHDSVPAPPAEGRTEAVLALTIRQLHRTRRTRQLIMVSGWLGIFLLGTGLGWLSWPQWHQPTMMASIPVEQPKTPPLLTAAQLELAAEKTDDSTAAAQLYRQAGDQFLTAQDIASALRCYRLHLTEGGPTVRTLLASDTWLLMNLKTNKNIGDVQ